MVDDYIVPHTIHDKKNPFIKEGDTFRNKNEFVLTKKDIPSAVGSSTVRGLGEVISGRSFPHIVQCVEATPRTCDLSVHRQQALPLAPSRPFNEFVLTMRIY